MSRAFPLRATIIESDGGSLAVLAHLPCNEGHFLCQASFIRVLSIAQKMVAHHLQRDLGRAREKNDQLACQLATRAGP